MNVRRRLYPRTYPKTPKSLSILLLALAFLPAAGLAQEVPPTLQEVPLYDERIPESLPMVDLTDPEGLNAFLAEVQRLQEDADALLGEAEAIVPPASPPSPPSPSSLPAAEQREIEAAQAYEATGEAPILALPNSRSFPFGHATPEIVCVPQRVCDIELEAGERYIDHRAGDHLNWQIVPGPELPDHLPDHITLRPREFGLHTNLILYTTQRTYHLKLRSPEALEASDGDADKEAGTYQFDQSIRFYYPDDWVARKVEARRQAEAETAAPPSSLTQPLALAPGQLNAAYTVKEPHSRQRRLPWRPVTVFDDGERTFLALPKEARH
jgi:type IV secretion system protein TrbG